jgi:hypothetical protein
VAEDFARAVELFVTFASGLGDSVGGGSLVDALDGMFCKASIVADWGGVFSPRMLWCGLRTVGRTTGVKLEDSDVGVSLSTDLARSFSRPRIGVEGLELNFSGDDDLGVLIESRLGALSSKKPRSLTLEGPRV